MILEPAGKRLNLYHIAYAGAEGRGRARLSPHYLLDIYREDRLTRFGVLVELNPAHTRASEPQRIGIAEALEHDIKSYVGLAVRVRIVAKGQTERSQGKAQHVRDRRPSD